MSSKYLSSKYLYPLLAGLGMSGAVYLVEASLAHAGMHGDETFLDDALAGIFAALTVFLLQRHRDLQQELRRQRQSAALIDQLNHHIRNALQVIVYRTELGIQNNAEVGDIRNAVNRIDWALREILQNGDQRAGVETAERGPVAASQSEPADRRNDSAPDAQS
jgi:hypothetical protein